MSVSIFARDGLCYLSSSLLPVPHGFTTRTGGVSSGYLSSLNLGLNRGDQRENVVENYLRLGKAIGFDPFAAVGASQVHGKHILRVEAQHRGELLGTRLGIDCDGLITNVPGIPLVVFSADCETALLYDPVHRAVGAVHSGWKGTALGIVKAAVEAMTAAFGTQPQDLLAALGPCIGQDCFETDANVPEAMCQALGEKAEPAIRQDGAKYHVDLKALNRTWLLEAGLAPEHIDISEACTACQPDLFWSYRRHGDDRGSLAAVIVLPEAAE